MNSKKKSKNCTLNNRAIRAMEQSPIATKTLMALLVGHLTATVRAHEKVGEGAICEGARIILTDLFLYGLINMSSAKDLTIEKIIMDKLRQIEEALNEKE